MAAILSKKARLGQKATLEVGKERTKSTRVPDDVIAPCIINNRNRLSVK